MSEFDDMELPPFKPSKIVLSEIGITQYVFEDVAHYSRPVVAEVYHDVDWLISFDKRLIGLQFYHEPRSQGAEITRLREAIEAAVAFVNNELNAREVALTGADEDDAFSERHPQFARACLAKINAALGREGA